MSHITQIPFSGFYESNHSFAFDNYIEYEMEELASFVDDGEILGLYGEYFDDSIDWKKAHEQYAKFYVDRFNEYFDDVLNINLGLTFESLSSPTYYNYTTDRIFCHLSDDKLKQLIKLVETDNLEKVIKDNCTSYPGFISHYSNDMSDWKNKTEYDHNEIYLLLLAALLNEGVEHPDTEVWSVDSGNGEMNDCIWNAIPTEKQHMIDQLKECVENNDRDKFDMLIQAEKDANIPMKGVIATLPEKRV